MLLSVIIPTRNRSAELNNLLDTLHLQNNYGFLWEVLVIDNGSSDDTKTTTEKKALNFNVPLKYFFEGNTGLKFARNRGLKEAEGKYVAFLDDDMLLEPTWISGIEDLESGRCQVVAGRILPKWISPQPSYLNHFLEKGVFEYLGILDLGLEKKPLEITHVFGGNFFVIKQLAIDVGGFHPDSENREKIEYVGDGETGLFIKLREKGYTCMYNPAASVFHLIDGSRLTEEFLKRKAFIRGIASSYTQLRLEHGLYNSLYLGNSITDKLKRLKKKNMGQIIQTLKHRFQIIRETVKNNKTSLEKDLAKSTKDGWQFHQKRALEDPNFMKYILQKDYFDT